MERFCTSLDIKFMTAAYSLGGIAMFRLITVTLAAMYAVLYTFGAEDRRVEVSRQATNDDVAGFTLAAFSDVDIESTPLPTKSFGVSDAEAIKIAVQAGADIRSGRTSRLLYGAVAKLDDAKVTDTALPAIAVEQAQTKMWYVTGSSVNLRSGPGTGNAVVGKLGFGAEAEVLGDKDGWYQIRTADNAVSGWIFGKLLSDARPG